MKLTRRQFDNLVNSEEEDLYINAINAAPEEYIKKYKKAKDVLHGRELEFLDNLEHVDKGLLADYLNINKLSSEVNTLQLDMMFCYGTSADHLDMRMKGWKAPKEGIEL